MPKLRFKGFTDDWVQRKFHEGVTEIGDGLHGTPVYSDDGDTYFINGNNLVNGQIVINEETKMVDSCQRSLADKELDDTTILMSINGTIGNLAYYSGEKLMLGKSAAYIKVSDFDKKFVYAYLQAPAVQDYFNDSLTGTTIKNLGLKAIREMKLAVPQDFEEQEKIGRCIGTLDNLIAHHQRKCDELKKVKKYMLQKMFPKKGEKVPEIRFAGFTDDWEQRKFGDVGSVSMCKRIFKDETTDEGDIPFFKIGTFGGVPDAYISRKLFEDYKAKYPYPTKGDILLSASGTIGRMLEYNGEEAYFQDSNIVWLSHDQSIDNRFLKVLYGIVKWDGIEGSTIQRLYNDNFLKTKFQMPSKEEQEKIGGYFANLDNLITLHQRRHDTLKEIKKYMLQNMFPEK